MEMKMNFLKWAWNYKGICSPLPGMSLAQGKTLASVFYLARDLGQMVVAQPRAHFCHR